MTAQRAGNAAGTGNPWQRFLIDFMRTEELSEAMIALILGYQPVSVERWLAGKTPPRGWEILKSRLDGRRELIRRWREMMREIRS